MELSRRSILSAPVALVVPGSTMEVEFVVRGGSEQEVGTLATYLYQACEGAGLRYVSMAKSQSFAVGKGAPKAQAEYLFAR